MPSGNRCIILEVPGQLRCVALNVHTLSDLLIVHQRPVHPRAPSSTDDVGQDSKGGFVTMKTGDAGPYEVASWQVYFVIECSLYSASEWRIHSDRLLDGLSTRQV